MSGPMNSIGLFSYLPLKIELEEAVTVKVTAKPTASDRAPVWV